MRSEAKAALFVILIIMGAYLAHQTGLADKLHPNKMESFLESFGTLAPVIFIALSSLRPLLFVPAGLVSMVGGLVFGSLLGTVYTVFGSTIGAILAFAIARLLGRELIGKISRGRIEKWSKAFSGQGAHLVFLTRLMPIFPFDAVSFAAGLSHLKFSDFALGTILGIVPGTFVYSFLGSTIHEGLSPRFIGAILLTLGLGLIPTVYSFRQSKQAPKE